MLTINMIQIAMLKKLDTENIKIIWFLEMLLLVVTLMVKKLLNLIQATLLV